jgi:FMN phosphatase YigB (HAD superfamily)
MLEKRLNIDSWGDKKIKAILFDLDGTLIDMHSFVLPLILVPLIWRFRKTSGPKNTLKILRMAVRAVKKNKTDRVNYEILLDIFQNEMQITRIETQRIFNDILFKDFPKFKYFFKVVPHAQKTLQAAKDKGLRIILATNPLFEEQAVKMRMDWGKIDHHYFELITHNQNSTSCKPSLDYYSKLLLELKLDQSECLMVGNDYTKDLPAAELGMSVLMVDGSVNKSKVKFDERWDYLTGTLQSLKQWIEAN